MVLAVRRDRPGFEAIARCAVVAVTFLSELKECHDLSEAELLVDGFGYLTALSQTDLNGQCI